MSKIPHEIESTNFICFLFTLHNGFRTVYGLSQKLKLESGNECADGRRTGWRRRSQTGGLCARVHRELEIDSRNGAEMETAENLSCMCVHDIGYSIPK